MNAMAQIVYDFATTQDHADADHHQDALVTVDCGGSIRQHRGRVTLETDGSAVAVWRTRYWDHGREQAVSYVHKFQIPGHSGIEVGWSEYPIHFPIERLAMIQWAEDDLS